MPDVVTTDLFKFVAVRPVQRIDARDTHRTIIRDPRTTTEDGVQSLRILARTIATPAAALKHWREIDLSQLEPLAYAQRELVKGFERLDSDDAPHVEEMLARIEADGEIEGQLDVLPNQAWDALYIADRTGPDAGPRLELPMGSLRLLHFLNVAKQDPHISTVHALQALRATPVIPDVIANGFATPPRSHPVVQVDQSADEASASVARRSERLRTLAQELHAAETLLTQLTEAPALHARPIEASTGAAEGSWERSQFAIDTAPTVRSILSNRLTTNEVDVLRRLQVTETASIPVAMHALQEHVVQLNDRAMAFADDPEFQGYVMETMGLDGDLRSPVSDAFDELPSIADIVAKLDPGSAPDVDMSGRIVPLGIGDLKVVKQTLLAYQAGEVAHIENVLKGESKIRVHRKLDRTELTVLTSEEETTEIERDTQSTDRFELKRETEQTIKEDMSIKAGLTVTATFGPVVTTASGDFAYATSKQESQKNSSTFAREVVDKSVSKVQTKTKTERTSKTISEAEETNTHQLEAEPDAHAVGIYRWVDKRYRAQIYNYGVRMLLEFVVPEPAAFYRAAQLRREIKDLKATPPPPFTNLSGQPLTAKDITEGNYRKYAARYGAASVKAPPKPLAFTGTSLVKEGVELGKSLAISTKEFVVPEGYVLSYYSATITALWRNHPKLTVQIGRNQFPILNQPHPEDSPTITNEIRGVPDEVQPMTTGSVPVSVAAYDIVAFAVNVQGICRVADDAMQAWRLETFDKLLAAYQALQNTYDQKVSQAQAALSIAIEGQNPAINRIVEQTELKKLCITMMTGQHFSQFNAMTDPTDKPAHHPEIVLDEALYEGPIVQFFEQAFEWEQMTYLFYPYFWGRKRNWVDQVHVQDPDPMFTQFLTAGYARVVVPVPMAYVQAVQYLLQSKDPELRNKVWRGGDRPTLDNDLYVSIAEEMRSQTEYLAGATPEGEPWEFTLPTTLVWLQPDDALPVFT